jgi:F pilus assembly protein of type IV secretion system/type IV secretory system conjugative DNA transfer VirD4/TraG family protein
MIRTATASFFSQKRRDSLPMANLLPYVMCGQACGLEPVHLLDDGSLGFALEFDLPVVDTEVGAEDRVSSLIDQALRAIPAGVHWQWFVRSSPFIEPQLHLYLSQCGNDPLVQTCTSHYAQRWRAAQHEGFFPQDAAVNFFPRTLSVLLALKSPTVNSPRTALETIFRPTTQTDAIARVFVETAQNLKAVLTAQGILATPMGANQLANWVADLLFPCRRFDHPPVSTGFHSVREAIASLGQIDPIELRGFRTVSDGVETHHRVASMLWHPRVVQPGMLNALILIRPTLCISLSARVLPLTSSTLQLKAQSLLNARSSNRFNEVETLARAQALSDVEQRLFSEGERLIEARVQVHLIETSAEEAEDAARAVCGHLRELDIEAAVEEDIGSSLILRGCLPFTVYEASERKFRRRRRFLSRDFADMHPAGGSWRGIPPSPEQSGAVPAPIVMYSNPFGEALFLDPSKAERNPHALVVGQSGSGKSFFVHDYLLHLWRMPDVRLFLVSIKPDYRKLALLLGRYIDLTLDSAESLNPFAGAPTLENQARWVAALSLMITEGRPGHHLSREPEIALQEASLAASARNWNSELNRPLRETVLEDICLELERRAGALGRDLAFQLLPYRRGPFRRLFNSERTLGLEDRFIFFNLGNILQQPCSAAASFCVFTLIDQVMREPSLRAIPKGLIADEVWALVQDPFAAAILERSLKAYRSLGGFALPIVQDPRDLDTPAGRVILVNTATKVILPMDRSGQDEISRFVRLNDRELELVRNLRLVKRRYSEFFVSVEGIHSAKGLIIPDPLRYAISTTDPADEAELERLFRQNGSMLQAVQQFARDTPYGIRIRDACARNSRGRTRWTFLLTILVSAIALASILVWPRTRLNVPTTTPAVTPRAQIVERQLAAEQAARLLSMDHELLNVKTTPRRTPPVQADESQLRGVTTRESEQPTQAIDELQALARSLSTDVGSIHKDHSERAASRSPRRASSVSASNKRSDSLAQIPARIEAASDADEGDPLEQMSLHANLLTFNPELFPRMLFEIRANQTPPQARFGQASESESTTGAWFEPGDTPIPGWMLVSVESNTATLMSSHGDFVQLSITLAPKKAY